MEKQTTFVAIGALRVKTSISAPNDHWFFLFGEVEGVSVVVREGYSQIFNR